MLLRTTRPVKSSFAALYLLVVFSSALKWGRRPALFCGVLCSVCLDFFFVRPRYSIAVTDTAYLITLAVFLIVAVVTSELALRSRMVIHEQWARAQARLHRAGLLKRRSGRRSHRRDESRGGTWDNLHRGLPARPVVSVTRFSDRLTNASTQPTP